MPLTRCLKQTKTHHAIIPIAMTIRLDIPFLPEAGYTAFLVAHAPSIHSVYFSLFAQPAVDARYRMGPWQEKDLLRYLPRLSKIPKYALINSRFYHPDWYLGAGFINGVGDRLMRLREGGLLDGIVFSDFYMLKALGDSPRIKALDLEAVPSVNAHIRTPRKLRICLELIAEAGFRPPRKILLDRELNRNPEGLRDMVRVIRQYHPDMAIGLLANEGCLPDCPYKPAHDAHLALGNMQLATECTYRLNADLGCLQAFRNHPERIFQSPFIRPEDVDQYASMISFIKLGGRTLGAAFLQKTIMAYVERRYDGNLLRLMDTLEALADSIHLAADRLPEDFHAKMTACTDNCSDCGYCRRLSKRAIRCLPLQLPDFRRRA